MAEAVLADIASAIVTCPFVGRIVGRNPLLPTLFALPPGTAVHADR
jgi:hypothetical protein